MSKVAQRGESTSKTGGSTQVSQNPVQTTIDFSSKSQYKLPENEPLDRLLNQVIEIEDVEFYESKYGELVLIKVNGKWYRTVSSVIQKQMHNLEETIRKGVRVRAKLKKVKRYFTLESPLV